MKRPLKSLLAAVLLSPAIVLQPITKPIQYSSMQQTADSIQAALKPVPQPQFPGQYWADHYRQGVIRDQQAALEAATAACEAQGGTYTSDGCYVPPPPPPPPVVSYGGNCSEWLAEAGVTDISDAMYVINAESGCNPWALNKTSGACGVAQELPCGKSGCQYGDGACEVMWMAKIYIPSSYGTWANAAWHERTMGWY